jgi:acyl-CoA reductase-like NAD-dependent aldehyde dehydrogenase
LTASRPARGAAPISQFAARSGKPAATELGGDNAFVVLEDADIEHAANCAVWSSLWFQKIGTTLAC